MEDIMKIVNSLKDSGLLLKEVSETVQIEPKEQKRGFVSTLLGTLGAGLLGNMLAGKGLNSAGYVLKDFQSKGDEIIRACYESKGSSIKKNSASSFN